MLKVIKYADKVITLKPYNTAKERDILLYTSSDYDFNVLFDLVKDSISIKEPCTLEELTYLEKKYILLELRNISVGELFTFRKNCNKCKNRFEFNSTFGEITGSSDFKYKDYKFHEAFSDDPQDYINVDLDELDVNEYDEILQEINSKKIKFNFNNTVECPHCKEQQTIILDESNLVINLSEDTLTNYYKTISHMVFLCKFTKQDVDNMYPFERTIYVGIINDIYEKMKQAGKK